MFLSNRVLGVLRFALPVLLAVGWLHGLNAAQPEDLIKYRRNVMKSQGGHMGATSDILRGKVEFGSDLMYHAEALAASLRTVSKLFPEGSDFGDTRAKPEVWKRRADFDKTAQEADKAGAAFLAAVKSNDKAAMVKTFGALADGCKGYHQDFREKE